MTAVAAAVGASCTAPPPLPGARSLPINGGAPENGLPATVMLADTNWMGGGMCSGSLIAPRVVISAKHCFENRGNENPSALRDWIVLTGPVGDNPEDQYGIEEVLTTPEVQVDNFDIEVVLLDRDVTGIDPYELRRDIAGLRVGDEVTLSGYGENPAGGFARKYSGEAAIAFFGPFDQAFIGDNELVTQGGAAACGGDSGGTVLDGAGALMGVIVRGASEDCGSEDNIITAITRVDRFLPLIDEGLQRTGVCVPNGAEICDGLDNDCDGQTDPGCADLFGPCERDDLCRSGVCRDAGDGPICTEACEPAMPVASCPQSDGVPSYCRSVGCGESYCSPGAPGPTVAGDACEVDVDCSTLRCRDNVCVTGCDPGQGECSPGEACAAEGASCGSCLPADQVDGPRGLGEPCGENDDCESGACANVPGDRYCTTRCDDTCPVGYHCDQGGCLRGDPGRDGEPCSTGAECANGLCQPWPEGSSCSSTCDPSRACPPGATCTELDSGGSACKPDAGILGEDCDGAADCFGQICANWHGDKMCSERCSAEDPCPTSWSCLDAGDGVRVCVPEETGDGDEGGGGCGCRVGARTGASSAVALAFALLLALARRRRVR